MPVELEDSHVVGSAEACRTPDDHLQHLFKFAWRGAYNLENLGGRGLLFYGLSKVLTCVGEFIFQIGNGGAAPRGYWRIAALRPRRLAGLCFRGFPACCATPSHLALPVAGDLAYHIARLVVQHSKRLSPMTSRMAR
jgi:hypothetical protein